MDIVDAFHFRMSRLRILVPDYDQKIPIVIQKWTISESDKLIHQDGASAQSGAIAQVGMSYKTLRKTPAPSIILFREEQNRYTLNNVVIRSRNPAERETSIQKVYQRSITIMISNVQWHDHPAWSSLWSISQGHDQSFKVASFHVHGIPRTLLTNDI